jgi:signal transduction histidine kinase
MFGFEFSATLTSLFAIFYLGIIIYLYERKNVTNILFFLISLVTVFWGIANYFSLRPDSAYPLFWARLVLFFAAPHAILFFIFTFNFPNSKLVIKKWLFYTLLVIMFLVVALTQTPFIFSSVDSSGATPAPVPGILIPLFALTVVGSIIAALVTMGYKYTHAGERQKEEWRLMLLGTSLSYLFLIITNFIFTVLFKNTSFNLYGPLYMLPTFIGMAYGILRYKLLNAKAIAVEVLTFFILLISLFEIMNSKSQPEIFVQTLVFIFFGIFSVLLIRSVIKEVQQRERIEILAKQLKTVNSILSHDVKAVLGKNKDIFWEMLDGTFGSISGDLTMMTKKLYSDTVELLNSVMDVLKSGQDIKPNFELFDFKEALLRVLSSLKPKAQEKGLQIETKFDENNSYSLIGDVGLITNHVLQNLIDNSINYTPEGKISISLSKKNAGTILFTIHDTGVGISKEDMEKLFTEGGHGTNSIKVNVHSTGYGLFIAKKTIDAHGGKIWAESEGVGKGATFFVELPLNNRA